MNKTWMIMLPSILFQLLIFWDYSISNIFLSCSKWKNDNDREKKDVCLLDSVMTHSILKDKNYFFSMTLRKTNVHTISDPVEMIDGSGNAIIMLPNGTILHIEDALLNTKTKRNFSWRLIEFLLNLLLLTMFYDCPRFRFGGLEVN